MPELPDLAVYAEALERELRGRVLERVRIARPFVLRSVEPAIEDFHGRSCRGAERLGKRLALEFDGELWLVIHLMIAGRLRWRPTAAARGAAPARIAGSQVQAALEFEHGALYLCEAGSKRRAGLWTARGRAGLALHDAGGIDPLAVTAAELAAALARERRTLKRALTDQHIVAGIGNAYSDEILHAARLSPFALTTELTSEEQARLHAATVRTLAEWTERLRADAGGAFPERVTAFRPGMAVHGRHRQPCPVCGTEVQRIARAENESNYCPRCQTGGRILADRALSRLLRDDWPKTVEELERLRAARPGG